MGGHLLLQDTQMRTFWENSCSLQCFDAVGWASGRSSGCKKLSHEVLAWLSVCSEVQMICIWSSWCHCHPIISCFIKMQTSLTFLVPAYPGCPGKEAIKWVSVCLPCKFLYPRCPSCRRQCQSTQVNWDHRHQRGTVALYVDSQHHDPSELGWNS